MEMMKQYFLSFYEIENIQHIIGNEQEENPHVSKRQIQSIVQDDFIFSKDEFLETPHTYEKSRCLHIFQINQSLKILREMSQRIHQAEDVPLSTLSRECQIYAIWLYKISHRLKNPNDNHTTIGKFQTSIKYLSKELPELESKIAGLRIRRHTFQKHERILMKMHEEDMKHNQNLQLAMDNRLEKERQLTRIVHCCDIIRNIYQCRKRSDLAQTNIQWFTNN